MRIPGIWDEWAEYDNDGFVCGIRKDAPEEAKKYYEQYLEKTKNAKGKKGIKL